MKKIIYIKYGELTLKGKNRKYFVSILTSNVKRALINFKGIIIEKKFDCMIITNIDNAELELIINILKFIPGIYYISVASQISNDINEIKKICLEIAKENENDGSSFRITCHRHDKNYFLSSNEIISIVAGEILSNTNYVVNLKRYSLNINIEIKTNHAIVFIDQIKGLGGLPVGSNGKVLVLLSGGIDSPIAAKLLMNRGLKVDFLTFITPPHTSEKALEKVRLLSKEISVNNLVCNSKLFICNFTSLMHELTHINKESYRITLMRRYFLRIAKMLKEKFNYDAIATGDSIGQVASQTIESMNVISNAIDNCLILRPLLALDKEQIITLAKFYNTFNTSILPYNDSCSLFAPKNPTTKPNIKTAIELENKLELIDDIMHNVIENHTWIEELKNGNWFKKDK